MLEQIAERGYAFNGRISPPTLLGWGINHELGWTAVGAISVFGSVHRVEGKQLTEMLLDLFLGATNEIENILRWALSRQGV